MNHLTVRERQILERLAAGDSYKEIAVRLGISVQTVNDHIKNLYRKLDVHSRGAATAQYFKVKQQSRR